MNAPRYLSVSLLLLSALPALAAAVPEAASEASGGHASGVSVFAIVFALAVLFVVGSATALNYLTGTKPKKPADPGQSDTNNKDNPEGKV